MGAEVATVSALICNIQIYILRDLSRMNCTLALSASVTLSLRAGCFNFGWLFTVVDAALC